MMSTPESTVEAVEVTQADREMMIAYEALSAIPLATRFAEEIRSGIHDNMARLQLVARHRLASLPVTRPTFEESWSAKEADGYLYGEDALEQVRFGWDIAMSYIPSPTDQAKLIEEMENLCAAMEYWAGLNEGCDTDTAASEIMSSGGAWPSVAYSSARDLLARNGNNHND